MRILAIDPGTSQSAVVNYDIGATLPILASAIHDNHTLCHILRPNVTLGHYDDVLVLEMVASYGMPVGQEVFETCVWIGRFIEAWGGEWVYVYRKDVKLCLCGDSRAKDSNIRRALIDRFPATGGGKTPQIGTKKNPGPLYGIKKDLWSALAVAVTYVEMQRTPTPDNRTGESNDGT